MGNGDNKGGSRSGGSNNGDKQSYSIFDNNGTIVYDGPWVMDSFTLPNSKYNPQTSQSTGVNGSTISVSFMGSQIQVLGMVPPGQGLLVANYSIDNGIPDTRRVPILSQTSPLYYQMFYVSPILPMDQHNLTVTVLNTGNDRNYTFEMFKVSTDGGRNDTNTKNMSTKKGDGDDDHNHGDTAAAIVGGVLSSIIFLLLAFLATFYLWKRKRKAQMAKFGQDRLPHMMYYARPVSDGTHGEKGMYTLEPASVIDTDSKFTFAMRRDVLSEPRQSWVSVNLPPSLPDTALVNARPISDWSSYKGSSVIAQHSHPEVSRFSSSTSMAISPMAFRERTLPPVPSRTAGPPSEVDTETSLSLSPRPHERRIS